MLTANDILPAHADEEKFELLGRIMQTQSISVVPSLDWKTSRLNPDGVCSIALASYLKENEIDRSLEFGSGDGSGAKYRQKASGCRTDAFADSALSITLVAFISLLFKSCQRLCRFSDAQRDEAAQVIVGELLSKGRRQAIAPQEMRRTEAIKLALRIVSHIVFKSPQSLIPFVGREKIVSNLDGSLFETSVEDVETMFLLEDLKNHKFQFTTKKVIAIFEEFFLERMNNSYFDVTVCSFLSAPEKLKKRNGMYQLITDVRSLCHLKPNESVDVLSCALEKAAPDALVLCDTFNEAYSYRFNVDGLNHIVLKHRHFNWYMVTSQGEPTSWIAMNHKNQEGTLLKGLVKNHYSLVPIDIQGKWKNRLVA